MSLLGLDKLARMFKIIKHNGGPIGSIFKLWRMDSLKEGTYVGCDGLGNKYFENKYYMIGRSRWVEYNPQFKMEYDATQVTAEWFGWLHYKTDLLPCQDGAKYCLSCSCWSNAWLQRHSENLSGTDAAYYPYSTTRPKIYVWDGTSVCSRPCFPC